MKGRKRILVSTGVALVILVGAAFGVQRYYENGPGRHDVYVVSVVRDGRVLRRLTVADMQKLDVRSVRMQGKLESGPTLLSVLRTAGVETFAAVTVSGPGHLDSGRLVLSRGQIDDDVLLDFANRGTVKVCGPRIAWAARVRDVAEIQVR